MLIFLTDILHVVDSALNCLRKQKRVPKNQFGMMKV